MKTIKKPAEASCRAEAEKRIATCILSAQHKLAVSLNQSVAGLSRRSQLRLLILFALLVGGINLFVLIQSIMH